MGRIKIAPPRAFCYKKCHNFSKMGWVSISKGAPHNVISPCLSMKFNLKISLAPLL